METDHKYSPMFEKDQYPPMFEKDQNTPSMSKIRTIYPYKSKNDHNAPVIVGAVKNTLRT